METLEVFSPLAQRLGMKEWQDELEDLAFKTINPDARNSIIERLEFLSSKDENIVDEIRYELKKIFLEVVICNGIEKDALKIINDQRNTNYKNRRPRSNGF